MKIAHIFVHFVLALLYDNALSENEKDYLIVNTSSGKVKGYKQDGVYEFYGIPYATAPTGVHKFKAPLPAPIWLETFDAKKIQIVCPQSTKYFSIFYKDQEPHLKENCLIANIYVPAVEKKNLPVVVFVHGGAYQLFTQLGAGDFFLPSDYVEQGEIIAVTFNYRLGVHGFLCLGTEDIPGNAGMKDMVALLRWVKVNIASFGGNPDDVTINGHSAGSSAVDMLMLSDAAKGLFNKVVPESGSAVSVWSVQIDPLKNARDYAQYVNFTSNIIAELEEFYKNAPLDYLTMDTFIDRKDSTFQMVPCVERDTGTERFLKDAPYNILKSGNFEKVPYLVGFANMEGLFRVTLYDEWKEEITNNFENFLPADLKFESQEEKQSVAKTVKEFYFGTNEVAKDHRQGFIDFFSDVIFVYPALRTVNLMRQAGAEYVYLYEYSYTDDSLPFPRIFPDIKGADHCAQTHALYKNSWINIEESNVSDSFYQVRSMMRKLWINFIKSGQPISESSDIFPLGWPAASSNGSPYMDLNLVPKLINSPLHKERRELWDKIYQKYYQTPAPPSETVSLREEL